MARRDSRRSVARGVFRFDGIAIEVTTSHARDLAWLEEFLSPSFRVGQRGPTDASVRFDIDDDAWQERFDHGPHPRRRQVECFFLDTKIRRHPVWCGGTGELVVYDGEFDVFYAIRRRERSVHIVARKGYPGYRLALLRVVRELATSVAHRRNRLLVHGAGVRMGLGALIIAGPKRAGKTSMLLHALRRSDTSLLSNDRVVVEADDGRPIVRGVPTIVSIRPGSLRRFPEIGRRLRSSAFFPTLRLTEAHRRPMGEARPWRNGSFTISPRQLRALTRSGDEGQAAIRAILFPRLTNKRGAMDIEPLSPTVAARHLRRGLFRARFSRKGGGVFHWFGRSEGLAPVTLDRLCRRVTREVPCYVVHVGRDAYRAPWPEELT